LPFNEIRFFSSKKTVSLLPFPSVGGSGLPEDVANFLPLPPPDATSAIYPLFFFFLRARTSIFSPRKFRDYCFLLFFLTLDEFWSDAPPFLSREDPLTSLCCAAAFEVCQARKSALGRDFPLFFFFLRGKEPVFPFPSDKPPRFLQGGAQYRHPFFPRHSAHRFFFFFGWLFLSSYCSPGRRGGHPSEAWMVFFFPSSRIDFLSSRRNQFLLFPKRTHRKG